MLKCLILEDEQAAQEVLNRFINKTPFLECLGTFENGIEIAPEQMKQSDILFLDIQLPELNGLSFLKTLTDPPKVIITTAYANHAVEAFDLAVADYLLKPFSFERFFKAVSRVGNSIRNTGRKNDRTIFIYADKTHFKVNIDDICFIKADIDYVRIVTDKQSYLVLDSLRNWKETLEKFGFKQIHRSYLINIDRITKISGNQLFIGDKAFPIGKKFKGDIMKIISHQ